MAYQMLTVAVGWQVYSLTGSALALGFVGLVQFLPAFALVLVVEGMLPLIALTAVGAISVLVISRERAITVATSPAKT